MTILTNTITVSYEYSVCFTRGLFEEDNPLFLKAFGDSGHGAQRFVAVVDSGVVDHHPDLLAQLRRHFDPTRGPTLAGEPLVVPGGERCKSSFKAVESVLRLMESEGIDRHSYVVAIGGGALLDMVGFAAGICHRGVRLIRVPTTVLAQNDSGVGVKNSFNLFGKKNFLGTFATPHAVLNDARFLTTLDQRDWVAGTAEAVKVALLKDRDFFAWIEAHGDRIQARDLDSMERLVRQCARLHMNHIAGSGDPFERGSSRPLDFGHWAAHKLEQLSDFELRHGEAVAIGLALDVAYSHQCGLLSHDAMVRILRALRGLGLAITHPMLFTAGGAQLNRDLLAGLTEFREHLGGQLTIMLLHDIGSGVEVHEMDHDLIAAAAYAVRSFVRLDTHNKVSLSLPASMRPCAPATPI